MTKDVYGRETVIFVEYGLVTYQSTEYANDIGYSIVRFKPSDDIMQMISEMEVK